MVTGRLTGCCLHWYILASFFLSESNFVEIELFFLPV